MSISNATVIEAWDTVLFEKTIRFRPIVMAAAAAHGDRAIDRLALQRGDRVIDLGCGFGETTRELARRVGAIGEQPVGRVVGIDASRPFVETARSEAREHIEYVVGDIERALPDGPYDAAFARFGLMFFNQPVIALRRICGALVPGGRLCATVWRRREDNDFLFAAQAIVEGILGKPDRENAITCGPGPFSMASADLVTAQLLAAGFSHVELVRSDADVRIGKDVDEAIALAFELGPAGETVRLAGAVAIEREAELRAALERGLRRFLQDDGVWCPSSAWILDARR